MSFYLRLAYLPSRLLRRAATFNRCSFWTSAISDVACTPLPVGYRVQWLSLDRLQELAEQPASPLGPAHIEILETTAAQCVAIFHGDELAGFAWMTTGDVPGDLNHDGNPQSMLPIYLPPGTAFLFGVLVMPPHRGRRLYGAMVTEIATVAPSHGIERLLVTTECSNYRALKTVRRMGFQELGRTTLLRVGPLVWTHYPKQLSEGTVRVGRYAGD
jgi:ribosomal protein S18 acetylase RimI-like enzyme